MDSYLSALNKCAVFAGRALSGFWGGRGSLPSTPLIRSYSPSAYGAVRDSARLG
jgi:hypothetical protein